ncbi:helix-turn-helix transcriptional regulator [Actinospica durhamensis]|uniref:Helix-turn-helix transcriptional regulator n=1 Tax=Actinospica durhamensis TaxID=1508375 RepID=A0A941IRC3_9ACTN|nr:helix-turn-helix domain-containing protein [Actinospica durhamensis]MBR7832151.1 helix-turn-helix transcriptional regulator [Actinospica durhamensis]
MNEAAPPVEQAEDPFAELRKTSDPRELRALAHPTRLALYEALGVHGSLTATQASKIVGGSPTSVAYHLRTLAKYGYAEEAGSSDGRERPWKLRAVGFDFSWDPDTPGSAAGKALHDLLFQRWLERREYYQTHRQQWPAEVREASGEFGFLLFGTLEEYRELRDACARLAMRYIDRIKDPSLRPEGSMMFEFNLFANPVELAPLDPADEEN